MCFQIWKLDDLGMQISHKKWKKKETKKKRKNKWKCKYLCYQFHFSFSFLFSALSSMYSVFYFENSLLATLFGMSFIIIGHRNKKWSTSFLHKPQTSMNLKFVRRNAYLDAANLKTKKNLTNNLNQTLYYLIFTSMTI